MQEGRGQGQLAAAYEARCQMQFQTNCAHGQAWLLGADDVAGHAALHVDT